MKRWTANLLIVGVVLGGLPVWAQGPAPSESRMRSGKLAAAGMITALVGIGMVVPHGDTYRVFGDNFCVTDYAVDYGSCSEQVTPVMRKIGMFAIAAGVGMTIIGAKRVRVSPTNKGVKATMTVKW